MSVYLSRDRKHAPVTMTAVHAAVSGLTRTEDLGHKLYRDSLSSPNLFNDLHTKTINCCGTIRPNGKVMPSNFGRKLRLKWGDIKTRVKCDLAAAAWEDKLNINVLTNMHHLLAEDNAFDQYINDLKPATVQDCNRHMGTQTRVTK
jgi:hypothetical protein